MSRSSNTGSNGLSKLPDSAENVWLGRGFGGQNLQVFPKEGLIVTFTAWDILCFLISL